MVDDDGGQDTARILIPTHKTQQAVDYLIEQNNKQMDSLKEVISRSIVEVRYAT